MPPAHRKGDIGSGHDCHCPPSAAIEGSRNVFVNGKPMMRVGDAYSPHGCPTCGAPSHGRKLVSGSSSVYINGKPAARIGDLIDCGGEAATGSRNVNIGNKKSRTASQCQAATATSSAMPAKE